MNNNNKLKTIILIEWLTEARKFEIKINNIQIYYINLKYKKRSTNINIWIIYFYIIYLKIYKIQST